MFLRKVAYTSPASRKVYKITSLWLNTSLYKNLSWRKRSYSGRGLTGKTVVWTKSSLKRRIRLPKINFSPRFKNLFLVTSFYLTPFSNRLTSLCFLSSGGLTYLLSTTKFELFSFGKSYSNFNEGTFRVSLNLFSPIVYIPLLTRLSLLELYPGLGIQYVRSPGTFARFIKINWNDHTALVSLPSGVHKSFSIYALAFLNPVSLKIKKSLSNTKSGFWRSFGVKPKVRGVAMNPVDHPHGGRTKAIKNPRTPWGKSTKLK